MLTPCWCLINIDYWWKFILWFRVMVDLDFVLRKPASLMLQVVIGLSIVAL